MDLATAITNVTTTFTSVISMANDMMAIQVVAIPVYIAVAASLVALAKRIIPGLGGSKK